MLMRSELITNPFNARYVANLLTKGGSGLERLSSILLDAKVDLNPHQVFAAIEALDNPYSKGRILADEVGLGKTIEAAIVIADKWARGKKNIIVVVPATLREQWAEELEDKFYLPTQVLGDGDKIINAGQSIIICSYNFCYAHEKELRAINWDMVVFDEAHKLRNLYTESNKIDQAVASIFKDTHKILLTATPLQNSLLDLYSLASLTDKNLFLDLDSFKERYIQKDNSKELAERLQTILTRTLRKQVLEYIRYTDRKPTTIEFDLTPDERELYEEVLKFCDGKDDKGKRKVTGLQRMTLLKELSSSPKALLETAKKLGADKVVAIAERIEITSKMKALTEALETAFARLAKIGAEQKAVIFTESLATQKYIDEYLKNKYRTIILNGSTKDRGWTIQSFKNSGQILISTEVGGEGLNLQFCSLVVNFDMPWNPQRIEQRIGRCHRYGQKHDVTVINFLCRDNYADARLYDLLCDKLKLFEGVFGASDMVLGVLEEMDFERRIADIMNGGRTKEEIDKAFETLQAELETDIRRTKESAKQKIFEYLDRDVASKFKGIGQELGLMMTRKQMLLWELAKCVVGQQGTFNDERKTMSFNNQRFDGKRLPCMIYTMDKSVSASERFRLGSPIADRIMRKVTCNYDITSGSATYHIDDNHPLARLKGKSGHIALYQIKPKNDWYAEDFMLVGKMNDGTILTEKECEQIIMMQASGSVSLSWCDRNPDGTLIKKIEQVSDKDMENMDEHLKTQLVAYEKKRREEKVEYFDQFILSIHGWADDKIARAEKLLKTHERKLNELKLAVKSEKNFAKKMEMQSQVKKAELDFAEKQVATIKAQDEIRKERDRIIAANKAKLIAEYEGRRDFILEIKMT